MKVKQKCSLCGSLRLGPEMHWLECDDDQVLVCEACWKKHHTEKPKPDCPKCGNNRQVWKNQITGLMTCHRATHGNIVVDTENPRSKGVRVTVGAIGVLLAMCACTTVPPTATVPYRSGVLTVRPPEYAAAAVGAIQRGERVLGRTWAGSTWGWTFVQGKALVASRWAGCDVPVLAGGAVCQSTPRGKRCGTIVALRPDGTFSMPHAAVESGWGIQSSNGFGDSSNPMDPAGGGKLPPIQEVR